MFASVLREITGYLDKRALISTFFPVLVFVGGVGIVVWTTVAGVDGAVKSWGARPATVQVVLVAGFLVLVAFLTFVLGNLREWQDRMCQGYWPTWAAKAAKWFAGTHRAARGKLIAEDEALQRREETLAVERAALPSPDDTTPGTLSDEAFAEMFKTLDALPAQDPPTWPDGTAAALTGLVRSVRTRPDRVEAVTGLALRLDAHLAAVEQQVRDRRAEVQQKLFLWYPQPPGDVQPTAMGNVVRAAEQHPSTRYKLDAVVLWTRLQPLLPKDFAETVKDAKVSVDLLLTMAGFLPLFGVPLTWWLVWRLPRIEGLAAWLTVFAIAVCAFALCRAAPRMTPVVAAGAGFLVVHTFTGFWHPVLRAEVGLLWTAALFVLSYLLYRNATHATLAYTERLRTAFDLYRWKLLEELRLKLPETLAEERKAWSGLSQFLYRGGTTDPTALHYEHPKPDPIA
ncbi:hypothetical protein FHS29_002098 [Saccharothrix tamanrassetensis]|uniref:Uncharacterized protein n=1 Tax=Saccharothrix tamanrassetensis TaxID=1051531 RepID=A0A841CHC2_9PSEU|nr:hypothetical protein [Saccharothrix tamanrassetensis]MBB5955517.1 hypothetical protein [Saccharothrix tamanrassetensis]